MTKIVYLIAFFVVLSQNSLVVSAINEIYPVPLNNSDYYYDSFTNSNYYTDIDVFSSSFGLTEPPVTKTAYFKFNITELPKNSSINITRAIFHYYISSYATSGKPAPRKDYYIQILNENETAYQFLDHNDELFTTTGWKYEDFSLNNRGILKKVNETIIRIAVDDAPIGMVKTMQTRAKEHTGGTYTAYLNITYEIISDEEPPTEENVLPNNFVVIHDHREDERKGFVYLILLITSAILLTIFVYKTREQHE